MINKALKLLFKKQILLQKSAFLLFLGLFFIFFSNSCSKKFQKGTIYMGTGGGFVGSWKEYQLNADGKLFFRQSNVDSVIYIKTLDSAATKKMFRTYNKLKIDQDNLDAPGNVYYYIGRREGKFRNHKVTFGNPEAGLPKDLQEYFNAFYSTIEASSVLVK
jgi:hypothetical protein